jgi:hypothetical protein
MAKFEVHIIASYDEDLGVMVFENGETAVYPTAKIAKRVADGMNAMYKSKCDRMRHKYVVVEKEA